MVSEIWMTVTVFGTCPATPLSVLQSCNNTTGRFTPFPSAFSSVLTSHSPLLSDQMPCFPPKGKFKAVVIKN